MRFAISLVVLTGVSGCADFPQLDGTMSERARQADYAQILPLDRLLAGVPPLDTDYGLDDLAARAARLRARASALRGPVLTPPTRARLHGAAAQHPR